MSTPGHRSADTPAFLGGDLPDSQKLALEEGHDADIPSTLEGRSHATAHSSTLGSAQDKEPNVLAKESSVDTDKLSKRHSSVSSASQPAGQDLEKGQPEGTANETSNEPLDPNIVDWDGPEDSANPYNWTAKKKWGSIAVLSLLTFLIPLASSMFAPGVPLVMEDFGTTEYAYPAYSVLKASY